MSAYLDEEWVGGEEGISDPEGGKGSQERGTYIGDDSRVQRGSLGELGSITRPESNFGSALSGCETGFERHAEVG